MAKRALYEKLVADAKKKITEISPQDAAARSKSGEAVIVDVRDKDEWDEEQIPARFTGVAEPSSSTSKKKFRYKRNDRLPLRRAAFRARSRKSAKDGYKNVRSIAGGLKAWKPPDCQ